MQAISALTQDSQLPEESFQAAAAVAVQATSVAPCEPDLHIKQSWKVDAMPIGPKHQADIPQIDPFYVHETECI